MLAGGRGAARPAPPPHRTATRALHGPTSRPGRRRPRRAGAPGWPWLRDPGLGGRVINSRPRRPLAPRPRPPHWQLPPTPDPARPGPGAPTWPQLPPAGGGSGPHGRGRGVGGGRSASPKPPRPEIFPNLLSLHPFFPRVPVAGGRGGGWLCGPGRALPLPGRRVQGFGVGAVKDA